jgi:hypothetical protein
MHELLIAAVKQDAPALNRPKAKPSRFTTVGCVGGLGVGVAATSSPGAVADRRSLSSRFGADIGQANRTVLVDHRKGVTQHPLSPDID